jgi:hypothetical protein
VIVLEGVMKNGKVHFYYIIGILIVLLIASLSVQWPNVAGLANIISFALTFASLILALIAIFQSLSSSNEVIRAISSVVLSSEKIKLSADAIEQSGTKLIELSSQIPERFQDVSQRLDENNEAIRQITEINKSVSSNKSKSEDEVSGALQSDDVIRFATLSLGATLALYVFIKCLSENKPIVFNDIFPGKNHTIGYMRGYLFALLKMGKVNYEREGSIIIPKDVSGVDADEIIKKTEGSANKYYIEKISLVKVYLKSIE